MDNSVDDVNLKKPENQFAGYLEVQGCRVNGEIKTLASDLAKFGEEAIFDALEVAETQRGSSNQPITYAYVSTILRNKAKPAKPWKDSWKGIENAGRALGVPPNPQNPPAFKAAVLLAFEALPDEYRDNLERVIVKSVGA